MVNDQGIMRAGISLGLGAFAALVAAVASWIFAGIRRDVHPAVPAAAGISVAIAAYVIDWYTERQQHGD